MQPETAATFDRKEFDWVKNTIRLMSAGSRERAKNPGWAAPVPGELGVQLTHRCNLRCTHCFQWSDDGFFRDYTGERRSADLDPRVFEKMLRETREARSRLYLWGGEPLLHRAWEDIAGMLEKDPRQSVLCTNGLLLDQKRDAILPISRTLSLLVSMDGFKNEHDAMRGAGAWDRLMQNLSRVKALRERGRYRGGLSLICVVNDSLAPHLFHFALFCEGLGVDSLYFNFPWYISPETASRMDDYFHDRFSWLATRDKGGRASWNAFTHRIDPSRFPVLKKQLKRLAERTWSMRLRLQPALERDEFEPFLLGSEQPAQSLRTCLAISNRMEIQADGRCSACKFFPEFTVGDLNTRGAMEIWRGERFGKIREIIDKGLTPVCSKCSLLYLGGR